MPTPQIRFATLDDLWQLRLLWEAMIEEKPASYPSFAGRGDQFTTALATAMTACAETFGCWVAEQDGRIVGFLMGQLFLRPIATPDRYFDVQWVYLTPAVRGLGLCRQLFLTMCDALSPLGDVALQGTTLPGDLQWERRGWVPFAIAVHNSVSRTRAALLGNGHVKEEADAPSA